MGKYSEVFVAFDVAKKKHGCRKGYRAWRAKTGDWQAKARLGVSFGLLRLQVEANGETPCAGCRLNASSRHVLPAAAGFCLVETNP